MFGSATCLVLALGALQAAGQGRPSGPGGEPSHGRPEQHYGPGGLHGVGFGGRKGAQAPSGQWKGEGNTYSPAYGELFREPLPIPPIAQPEFTEEIDGKTVDYYSIEIKDFQQQVYPDKGPANLVGYDGMAPGPTFMVQRYHETIVRYLNHGSSPSVVHLHGSYTHAPWDGWAEDSIEVGQYKDFYYPNSEPARPIWYHDHIEGNTATDAYYGQAGVYIIYDPAEDALGLPSGDYDIPLALADKKYQENGDLLSPDGAVVNFFGDTIHVNEQPWPYLEVEPRKYRFRFYDMSLSRAYDLYFQDSNGNQMNFQVIASDSGLFGSPVPASDVIISMGERYEVIVDFSAYKGQNITLMNGLQLDVFNDYENTDKVMQFKVGDSVSDSSNNGDVPSTLNPDVDWPEPKNSVDHTFNFQGGGENGAAWTINGIPFTDVNNRILAKPEQDSTELWELVHAGGPAVHPVHIHLVNMQVVSRSGGSRGVLPYEAAGLKDVVLLEPGETVQVLAYYGPWNGVYMFHCHNLIHEDNVMMDAFNVTLMKELGYNTNNTIDFADPMDPRFSPKQYNAAAFEQDAIRSTVHSLVSMDAYQLPGSANAVSIAAPATAAPSASAAGGNSESPNSGAAQSTAPSASSASAAPTSAAPGSSPGSARASGSPGLQNRGQAWRG